MLVLVAKGAHWFERQSIAGLNICGAEHLVCYRVTGVAQPPVLYMHQGTEHTTTATHNYNYYNNYSHTLVVKYL
jgi:hypothetical protein